MDETDPDFLFIDEIRSHPALYNSSHVNYANTYVRHKLWGEISKKFNLKAGGAKIKWKDFRDRYVREKKKEEKRTKPRPSAYPPWKCIPKLKWLDEHLRAYTYVTRLPTTGRKKKSKKGKKDVKPLTTDNKNDKTPPITNPTINYEKKTSNTKTIKEKFNNNNSNNNNKSKEIVKIEYEITNNEIIKEENEYYDECKIEEVDPFKITIEHKCGQIYIENEKLIFLCDFCENMFYESTTFSDHILNFHRFNRSKYQNDSSLNLDTKDVEFLDLNDDDMETNEIGETTYDYTLDNNKDDKSNDYIDEDTQSSKYIDEDNDNMDDLLNSKHENVEDEPINSIDTKSDTENDDGDEPESNIFNITLPQKVKNDNGEYPCPICNKTYRLYHSLTYHFRNLHAFVNKCEHCGEIFQSGITLKTHLRKIHRIFKRKIGQEELLKEIEEQKNNNEIPLVPPPIRNEDDRFICLICNNNYSRHDTLRKHHNNVHLKKEKLIHRCELCDKTFQTKYILDIHKATHNPEHLYKCTKCDADFVHPKFLAAHLRSHLGNRKYPCEYCDATFPKRIDKISHERANHTKEKPYQCEDCLESFTKYSELVVHKNRKHNPNRKRPSFQCEYCNRIFHRKDTYISHVRRHQGIKPFQCNICMAKFAASSILRSHKRLHKRNE